MAFEATFRHTEADGSEWLYHLSLYGEGGSGLDLSNPVDREHYCCLPWKREPGAGYLTKEEPTMRDHDERNRSSRERMARLTERMDADTLNRPLGEHWTIAAGLLHIASWDRFVFERWAHADANGLAMPVPFSPGAEDVVNGTLTPLLMRVPAEEAIQLALETALTVEQLIAGLSAERVETALRDRRERMVDRSIHRTEHLDEIEATLA